MNTQEKTQWGITPVTFDTNNLWAVSRPTTQEDNYGGITDRWDLYHIPYHKNNGQLSEIAEGKTPAIGKLVKYNVGAHRFAMFLNNVRIKLHGHEITFGNKI